MISRGVAEGVDLWSTQIAPTVWHTYGPRINCKIYFSVKYSFTATVIFEIKHLLNLNAEQTQFRNRTPETSPMKRNNLYCSLRFGCLSTDQRARVPASAGQFGGPGACCHLVSFLQHSVLVLPHKLQIPP